MFRLGYNFDPQAIQIFKAESGSEQHAKTQITIFVFQVEIKFEELENTSKQAALMMRDVG